MLESFAVRDAILGFYEGVSTKAIERFDDIVSSDPATVVIGTAPGEIIRDRKGLRFGFETEGITIEGDNPIGYEEGSMGWGIDEPRFVFPDGSGMRTRLSAVLRREDDRWKVVHMHFSAGVPDEEVVALQEQWGVT